MSRISSAGLEFCDPSRRRKGNAGFTLVELLVVITIICLLVAILMPILGRVREAGKRAKCAANLHSIGQMATTFANDHHGFFPACYRMEDTTSDTYPYRVPQFISLDTTHDPDDSQYGWQRFGTSWPMWQQYNASLDLFTCPDAQTPTHEVDLILPTSTPPSLWNNQYGNFISTNYMYLGGLSDQNMAIPLNPTTGMPIGSNQSYSHWAGAPPAVSTSGAPLYVYEQNPSDASSVITVAVGVAPLSQTVLAADMVYFSGTGVKPPIYNINHPQTGYMQTPTGLAPIPDFQNVLYGDGRVEGHARAEYPYALSDNTFSAYTGPNAASVPTAYGYDYSMQFAGGQPGFYYWGEPESTPYLTGLTPPTNNTLPPNPNTGSGGNAVKQSVLPVGYIAAPPTEPLQEGTPQPLPN